MASRDVSVGRAAHEAGQTIVAGGRDMAMAIEIGRSTHDT
jgi:hypothetical protein